MVSPRVVTLVTENIMCRAEWWPTLFFHSQLPHVDVPRDATTLWNLGWLSAFSYSIFSKVNVDQYHVEYYFRIGKFLTTRIQSVINERQVFKNEWKSPLTKCKNYYLKLLTNRNSPY